eukprot:jgi/Bigna1/137988/aug1.42_g12696
MESFEDFLLMLYAENEAVDEKEIDEIIKHADLYTVDEKFIEEMYNTFLQTDLECSSRGFSMSDGLSSEHLQSYKQSFNRYDADKDGKITMIEMENHLMGYYY